MEPFLAWIITAAIAGAGAYFGSYLKQKGENVATHEDLDKLVNQMTAITQATKAIEAKISNEIWERQKQWEIKKEAVFEALRELGNVEAVMAYTAGAYQAVHLASTEEAKVFAQNNASKAAESFRDAFTALSRAKSLADGVISLELSARLSTVISAIMAFVFTSMTQPLSRGRDDVEELISKLNLLREMMKGELGLPTLIPPRTGSSAVPTPD